MNVFDLCATISIKIDDFEKGVEKAKDKTTDLADKVKSVGKGISSFASTVGKGFNAVSSVGEKALTGLKTAGTVAAAGITAATAAVTALGKASIDSYADYEQLVGGVETLFGAGGKSIEEYAASVGKTVEEIQYDYTAMMEGQEKVLSNASTAYKTAGLSANEYMETVTSFAAALVSSLDGQKDIAADVADTAIRDMADNANKMGTSMESIQNAYQGFAKQNYTMLDNLKLGFGGTKEEMQRLLDTAGELTGREFDISNFADIVDAIHAVQEEMGITGTTAKEASQTISGSIASMKAAWQNLLAGFGNEDADLGQLVGNVVDGFSTVAKNVMPRIQAIAGGIVKAIPDLVKSIAGILPEFLEMGVEAGRSLIDGFGEILPDLISAGGNAIENIAAGIAGNIDAVIDGITSVVSQIAGEIGNHKDELKTAGSAIIHSLAEGFSGIVNELLPLAQEFIPTFIEGFLTYKETLFTVGLDIITVIANGLAENIGQIVNMGVDFLTNIITAIQENLPMLAEAAITIITGLADGLGEALPDLIPAIVGIIIYIGETIIEHIPDLLDAAWQIIKGIAQGLLNAFPELRVVWDSLKKGFADVWSGIKNTFSTIGTWFKDKFTEAKNAVINVWSDIKAKFSKIWSDIKSAFNFKDALNWGRDLIQNFIDGITAKWNALKDKIKGVAQTVKNFLGFSEPKEGPLSNFHTYAPDMMKLFAQGIEDNAGLVRRQFDKSLDFGTASVEYPASRIGRSVTKLDADAVQPITIVVQSVLDGRIIGESTYKYLKNRERAYGMV